MGAGETGVQWGRVLPCALMVCGCCGVLCCLPGWSCCSRSLVTNGRALDVCSVICAASSACNFDVERRERPSAEGQHHARVEALCSSAAR